MIINLLATILISFGIGSGAVEQPTATNFHNAKMQTRESQRIDSTTTASEENYITNTDYNIDNHQFIQWEKTDLENTSQYINVNGNRYTENRGYYYDLDSNEDLYWTGLNYYGRNLTEFEEKRLSRTFYVMEITPYITLTENDTEIYLGLQMTFDNGIAYNFQKCGFKIKQWTGQSTTLSRYLNMQNTFTNNYNYDLENELNNNFTLSYTEYEIMQNVDQNRNVQNITIYIDQQAWIYNTTNYMILELIPTIDATNSYTTNLIQIPEENGFYPQWDEEVRLIITDAYTLTITFTGYITSGTQEVIDLPGLMFDILTMPFAFISQAFNLTLFPGTPYSFNVSNFFLTLVGIAVFITIIKLILGR